jgi:putative aminopeptidase FrvX
LLAETAEQWIRETRLNIGEAQEFAMDLLEEICGIPTVTFHEKNVANAIADRLSGFDLEITRDPHGNLLATSAGTDADAPGIANVAHMDHPGFELVERRDDEYVAGIHGGITRQSLEADVPVLAVMSDGRRVSGRVLGKEGEPEDRQVLMRFDEAITDELPVPVILDLIDFKLDGDVIRARALDDLGGCAAVAGALAYISSREVAGNVYGLFTRAEEGGLFGARLAASDGLLPKDTAIVSVETSHILPGAESGDGVVIRTGDAVATFDEEPERYLRNAALKLREVDKEFKVKRQLMSGGGCEASGFAVFGYKVTGTAFPLGNWHNGLMQEVVEPEYIHKNDFLSGVSLLCVVAESAGLPAESASVARLSEFPGDAAARLAD